MGNPVTSGYATTQDLNIEIDFDLDKIDESIRTWEQVQLAITRGIKLGEQEVIDRMELMALKYLSEYGLGGSEIAKSISTRKVGDGYILSVGSDYAIYVEYGTGIVGANSPHPKSNGWVYDKNGHGSNGWYYPTTHDDPNPHKRMYNDQLYAWTKGQRSRPFMYKTWKWARQQGGRIIMKNVNREIRKVRGVK